MPNAATMSSLEAEGAASPQPEAAGAALHDVSASAIDEDGIDISELAEGRVLQSGSAALNRHKKTLFGLLKRVAVAHEGSRIYLGFQSAYSTEAWVFKHNLGSHAADMDASFTAVCAERASREVVARLRSQLASHPNQVLVAKVVEQFLELLVADGWIGRKLAGHIRSSVTGAHAHQGGLAGGCAVLCSLYRLPAGLLHALHACCTIVHCMQCDDLIAACC